MNQILPCRIYSFLIPELKFISLILNSILVVVLLKLKLFFFVVISIEALFYTEIIHAKPKVGVFSVNFYYPSNGLDWLSLFIQEELSLQLQLADRFSIISPESLYRWNEHLTNYGRLDTNPDILKNSQISQLKPDKILRLSLQKVLKKLSVNWEIDAFDGSKPIKIQKIHSWKTPDELIASLLEDLVNGDKFFSHLNHYPLNYSWNGIRSFYQWRLKPFPVINTLDWTKHKNELKKLLLSYPNLSSSIKYRRAIIRILESSLISPPHVPSLNSAEGDIVDAMKNQPGNGDHHTLLSLVHFLRREPLFAKQQANIASKINHTNGLALIIYGLTIGKTAHSGDSYIRRGLQLYPFVSESNLEGLQQPYNLLVKDLEPWLISSVSEKTTYYEELMISGKENFNARQWEASLKSFEDASTLEPGIHEPLLYIAKIMLAQNELESANSMFLKLIKKFPKNIDIVLYYGYTNEKLKNYIKAEELYRQILLWEPEHHKALLRLGTILIKLGKRAEARSFLESLTQKYPMYNVAWWNLGIVYYQIGEIELAEMAWEESLRLDPANNQVRVSLEQIREELL